MYNPPTFVCAACGNEHDIFTSLPQECLDAAPTITDEELSQALREGYEEYKKASWLGRHLIKKICG